MFCIENILCFNNNFSIIASCWICFLSYLLASPTLIIQARSNKKRKWDTGWIAKGQFWFFIIFTVVPLSCDLWTYSHYCSRSQRKHRMFTTQMPNCYILNLFLRAYPHVYIEHTEKLVTTVNDHRQDCLILWVLLREWWAGKRISWNLWSILK